MITKTISVKGFLDIEVAVGSYEAFRRADAVWITDSLTETPRYRFRRGCWADSPESNVLDRSIEVTFVGYADGTETMNEEFASTISADEFMEFATADKFVKFEKEVR
jgi:hypothetical protein